MKHNSLAAIVSLFAGLLCASSISAQETEGTRSLPSDADRLDGDHLIFRTNASGFIPVDGADKSPKCAPVGSKLSVRQESADGKLIVRFYDVPPDGRSGVPSEALKQCPVGQRVNIYTSYTILKSALTSFDFRRTGVSFGGLVIPFKFRLRGDKGIISSSTVAPYVGFRTAYFQGFGLSFTPIASAGLGLVPVVNPDTGKTDTKSAFSLAGGLVMTSTKNDRFNAGLIFGRDFLSKSDRALDSNVEKPWLSFYLGVSL